MLCRSCGTDIADKALVCYRCGAPTAEPVQRRPAALPHRRARAALALAVAIVLVASGVVLLPHVPPGVPRLLAYAALAVVGVASLRLIGRR